MKNKYFDIGKGPGFPLRKGICTGAYEINSKSTITKSNFTRYGVLVSYLKSMGEVIDPFIHLLRESPDDCDTSVSAGADTILVQVRPHSSNFDIFHLILKFLKMPRPQICLDWWSAWGICAPTNCGGCCRTAWVGKWKRITPSTCRHLVPSCISYLSRISKGINELSK